MWWWEISDIRIKLVPLVVSGRREAVQIESLAGSSVHNSQKPEGNLVGLACGFIFFLGFVRLCSVATFTYVYTKPRREPWLCVFLFVNVCVCACLRDRLSSLKQQACAGSSSR